MQKEGLMTRKELMEYLKISRGTLYKLMKKRAFPYIKLERKILFKKSEIDAFLEKHVVK
jgi:excisionase family DNA binding protein